MFRAAFSLKIGEVMPYWPNNKHKSGYLVELRLSRACFWNWERKSWKKKPHTKKQENKFRTMKMVKVLTLKMMKTRNQKNRLFLQQFKEYQTDCHPLLQRKIHTRKSLCHHNFHAAGAWNQRHTRACLHDFRSTIVNVFEPFDHGHDSWW